MISVQCQSKILAATNLEITKEQEQTGHVLTQDMTFIQQGTEKLVPQYDECLSCGANYVGK